VKKTKYIFLIVIVILFSGCGYNTILNKADRAVTKKDYNSAIQLYSEILEKSKDEIEVASAELGIIDCYVKINNFKNAYKKILEIENNNYEPPFAEWLSYNRIITEYNLNLFVETFNTSSSFLRTYKKSKVYDKVKEYAQLSMNSLGKSVDINEIIESSGDKTDDKSGISSIKLEITDYYKDDFGYIFVSGVTEPNASVYLNNEKLNSDNLGNFSGKTNFRFGRPVVVKAEKSKTEFSTKEILDTEEPNKPQGLEIANHSSNSVSIRWNANDEKDILGYNIYAKLDNSQWEKINRNDEFIKKTEYTVNTKIPAGSKIYIRITALDKMRNESEPSDYVEEQY